MPNLSRSPTFEYANGTATWPPSCGSPTQAQLAYFLNAHREELSSLSICIEYDEDYPALNFEQVGRLPALTSLDLSCTNVTSLCFTRDNTPGLKNLSLSNVSCQDEDGLRFELALPHLTMFDAEHVIVDGECDFGLSLSRCPNLKTVRTYKLRCLSGDNFAVLPSCESLTLHRSEGTESLEIISAPKLKELSVQAAYELGHLRLWDIPQEVSAEDVKAVVNDIDKEGKEIGQDINKWAAKWKDGTFGGDEALRLNWIEPEDVDGFNFETEPYISECLHDEMQRKFESRLRSAKSWIWENFLKRISARPVVYQRESLPNCEVNCLNAILSNDSRAHLMGNDRLTVVGIDEDDYDHLSLDHLSALYA